MSMTIASIDFVASSTTPTSRIRRHTTVAGRTRAARVFALAVLLIVSGCTTSTITPELVTTPPQTYSTVAVGEITMEGDLWHHLIPHFRHGMLNALRESEAFANTVELEEGTPLQEGIIVTGEISEVDEGSAAARWIVGFGAGRAKARGNFTIRDSNGVELARFGARQAYSGGAGIGGASFVSMEQLLSKLGESTAGSVIRWSKGEPLEPPRE